MIKVNFEAINDNDEWEKVSQVCESIKEAQMKIKSINNMPWMRNPVILEK